MQCFQRDFQIFQVVILTDLNRPQITVWHSISFSTESSVYRDNIYLVDMDTSPTQEIYFTKVSTITPTDVIFFS